MGGEFGDEDERKITRLENSTTPSTTGSFSNTSNKSCNSSNTGPASNPNSTGNPMIPPPSPLQGSNSNPIVNNLNGGRVSKLMNGGPGSPATSIASSQQISNLNSNKINDLPRPNSTSAQQPTNSTAAITSLNIAPLVNGNFLHRSNSSPHTPVNGGPGMNPGSVKSDGVQIKSEPNLRNHSTPPPSAADNGPQTGGRFQSVIASQGNVENLPINDLSNNSALFNNNLMPKQERKPQQTPSPLSNTNGTGPLPNQSGPLNSSVMGHPPPGSNMSADASFMPNQMPPHSTNMPSEFNHSFSDIKVS